MSVKSRGMLMVIPNLVITAIAGAADVTGVWTTEFATEGLITRRGLVACDRHLTDHRPHSDTLLKGEIR